MRRSGGCYRPGSGRNDTNNSTTKYRGIGRERPGSAGRRNSRPWKGWPRIDLPRCSLTAHSRRKCLSVFWTLIWRGALVLGRGLCPTSPWSPSSSSSSVGWHCRLLSVGIQLGEDIARSRRRERESKRRYLRSTLGHRLDRRSRAE
jgi:hypothetical protein